MTDKKELLGFLQDALVFQNRDDVDERMEYYEIYDNGTLVVVEPRAGASFGTKVVNELKNTFLDFGLFGSQFDSKEDQSFFNDPRKGRDTKGVPLVSLRNVTA